MLVLHRTFRDLGLGVFRNNSEQRKAKKDPKEAHIKKVSVRRLSPSLSETKSNDNCEDATKCPFATDQLINDSSPRAPSPSTLLSHFLGLRLFRFSYHCNDSCYCQHLHPSVDFLPTDLG